MRWPWVTRARLDREVAEADTRTQDAIGRELYWRARAEKLTDAALVRAGAIHEPTFVERKAPTNENPMALVSRAMGVREIDSSKH